METLKSIATLLAARFNRQNETGLFVTSKIVSTRNISLPTAIETFSIACDGKEYLVTVSEFPKRI